MARSHLYGADGVVKNYKQIPAGISSPPRLRDKGGFAPFV